MQSFINEAENMLNSATMGMGKMDFSSAPSGHTPSVIGTQEVYRWASFPVSRQSKQFCRFGIWSNTQCKTPVDALHTT